MFEKPQPTFEDFQEAEKLWNAGYRQTSRKFRHVSRADKSTEDIRKMYIKRNYGNATSGLAACSEESMLDFYRRCDSPDTMILSPNVFEAFKQIQFSKTGSIFMKGPQVAL